MLANGFNIGIIYNGYRYLLFSCCLKHVKVRWFVWLLIDG